MTSEKQTEQEHQKVEHLQSEVKSLKTMMDKLKGDLGNKMQEAKKEQDFEEARQ